MTHPWVVTFVNTTFHLLISWNTRNSWASCEHQWYCVEKENQLDATEWFIALIQGGSNMAGTDLCVNKCKQSRSYLNHLVICSKCFGHFLCPSSGARDYMCVITAYGVRCLVCWLLQVRYRAAGNASGLREVARICRTTSLIPMGIEVTATCWAYRKCNKAFSDI